MTGHQRDPPDTRFIVSPAGTVHQRREWKGEKHDYELNPQCGQWLPAGSEWSYVHDVDDVEVLIEDYRHLTPCSKCFNTYRWSKRRRELEARA